MANIQNDGHSCENVQCHVTVVWMLLLLVFVLFVLVLIFVIASAYVLFAFYELSLKE